MRFEPVVLSADDLAFFDSWAMWRLRFDEDIVTEARACYRLNLHADRLNRVEAVRLAWMYALGTGRYFAKDRNVSTVG